MASSEQLKVVYVGDASNVQNTLKKLDAAHKSLASKLQSIGSKVSSAGATLSKTVTLPLVAAGVAAFKLADDYADATATIQQHLKTMGAQGEVSFDKLTTSIQKMSMATGVSQTELLNAAGKLVTFSNVVKGGTALVNRATAAANDLAASGFGSVDSAATMLGKALDNPIKGLTSLTRVGVSFSDQQAKVITKLVESGDVAKAQGIIMQAVEDQVGGTAAKIADPWDKAKVALQNAAITIGTQLAPFVAKLSVYVQKGLKWFNGLSDTGKKWVGIFAAVAAAIGPVLFVVGKMVSGVGKLISTVKSLATAFNLVTKFAMANPWVLIAAAVVALVVLIVTHWDKVKAALLAVWDAIKTAGIAVWNALKLPVLAYFNFWKGIFQGMLGVAKAAFNGVAGLWNNTVGRLSFTVPSWVPVIGGKGFSVPDIPMLAKGGIVTKPTLAMIGEAGPEAVVPLSRGGMGGGITVNFNGPVYGDPREIALMVQRELLKVKTRSGSLGLA